MLPIIRSLGQRGIEMHLGWCAADEPVLRSRYLAGVASIRPWRSDSTEWLGDLRALLSSIPCDLVVPATEAAQLALQLSRHLVADLPEIHLLDQRAFTTCFDKVRTHQLAQSLGIAVPRSIVLHAGDDWARRLHDWCFPLAIKPIRSVVPSDVRKKQFVRRVNDTGELDTYLSQAKLDEVQVQEWFAGTGVGLEFLACDGELLFAFQHERLHETIGYGSTYRKSTSVNPALRAAVCSFLRELAYTGVGMAEFRTDPDTGRFVLLEINPRFWGSLPLAVGAGADFPLFVYEMHVNGRRLFPATYRTDIRCRNLLNDVRWMWRALAGKTGSDMTGTGFDGWAMNVINRQQLAKDLIRALLMRDRLDTFSLRDPAPAVAELWLLAKTAVSSLRRQPLQR